MIKMRVFYPTVMIRLNGRLLVFNHPWHVVRAMMSAVYEQCRKPFPYWYVRTMHDCDSGGLPHAWCKEWALNYWTFIKQVSQDYGDGPDRISRITPWTYYKIERRGNL